MPAYPAFMMTKSLWIFMGVAVVGGILSFAFFAAGPEQAPLVSKSPVSESNTASPPIQKAPPQRPVRPFSGSKPPLPADQQEKAIAQGELISSLFEAGSTGGQEQIDFVYAALSHPNAEVRSAAVEVIVQYVGKEGIPKLQIALEAAPSSTEKAQIAEAIEFLKLPSFREVHGSEATLQLLKRSGPRKKKTDRESHPEIPRR